MEFLLKKKNSTYVLTYINQKIESMENKTFLNKGLPYTSNAIDNWRKIAKVWSAYEKHSGRDGIQFHQITMQTYFSFLNFCDCVGYNLNTKFQYITMLKAAMNYALEEGLSSNTVHLRKSFSTHTSMCDNPKVYLSEEEIASISSLPLDKCSTLSKVRDVFLMGCYTGQRVSDYCRLGTEDIVPISLNGVKFQVFRKKQKKTGTTVLIPIINDKVYAILDRWGGILPTVAVSTLNSNIKKICRMSGIDAKLTKTITKGGKLEVHHIPKYQLVSSHTARRSCITNLYLSGKLNSTQIRSISGHKSESSFSRYLCQSQEEDVKSIIRCMTGIG